MNNIPRKYFKTSLSVIWFLGLPILILAGLIAGGMVLTQGLGITNLTDLVPWGLWITIDLSAIALSAGAFSLCAAVYLLGLKKYEPVARTATFIGIIGYSMAMMCLLMDIGRPDRFWHGFVYWNTHSVLWEVTMCVGLYFTVLALETLPIIGSTKWMQSTFPWLSNRLTSIHHIAPILAIFGLAFSLLHQSSLGATYGVLQSKPVWYRPSLAVLFIISAVIGGISLTILASMLAARTSSRARVNDKLLDNLARIIGWALIGYLYLRFWDTFAQTYTHQPGRFEGLEVLTKGSLAFNFWFGEIILGIIVPIILLVPSRFRRNPNLRMIALALVVGGVIAYRWDTNLVGQLVVLTYLPQEIIALYTSYTPSLIEIIAGVGVVAYGMFAFTIGVRFFNVVDHQAQHTHVESTERKPAILPEPVATD